MTVILAVKVQGVVIFTYPVERGNNRFRLTRVLIVKVHIDQGDTGKLLGFCPAGNGSIVYFDNKEFIAFQCHFIGNVVILFTR